MKFGSYTIVLFDWGNTLMYDDPNQSLPMVTWPAVKAVPGAEVLLKALSARGIRLCLATSADISSEAQIRGALARVGLDLYLEKIYAFTNTGLRKTSPEFYRFILDDLDAPPQDVLMVGDNLEYDVLAACRLGMDAVWFNPNSSTGRAADNFITVHSLPELLVLFNSAG